MTEETLTISAIARRAGIRPSAIRYYESIGLLPAPRRVSGQRRYAPDALQRLAVIQMAKEAGFTIADMRRLFLGFEASVPASTRWQTLAHQKLAEVEAQIRRAEDMKRVLERRLQCRCLTLEDCARPSDRKCG